MFKKCRKVVAAAVACVFVMGIAAYAQTQAPAKRQLSAQQRQMLQQKMQERKQAQPGQSVGAATGQARERVRARMRSLQALLAPPRPHVVQRLANELGLTDQQKQQIKQLYVQFANTTKPIRERKMAAVKEFMTAFRNPAVTKGELQRLAEPVLQADRAILDAEFDFWMAFRGILRPEQQAQFESLMMRQGGMELRTAQPGQVGKRPAATTERPAARIRGSAAPVSK